MRSSRVADGAEQFVEAESKDEAFVGPVAPPADRMTITSPTLMAASAAEEPDETLSNVSVDAAEVARGVARTEVVTPPP